MNPFLLLILTLIIASYLLDTLADVLNLRHLSPKLPAEFTKVFSPQKYKKSQLYLQTKTKFGLFQSTLMLLLTLAVITSGAFNTLDLFSRSFGFSPIPTGLIFVSTLTLLLTAISLPFSLYSTFVIEEKFGFNQTTLFTFATDTLKSLALSLVLTNAILAALIWFFSVAGSWAWVISWLTLTTFQLFLTFIAPVVIMPLFNKFTPLHAGKLRTQIEQFAKGQNFQLEGIYTMDGSRRSTKANAFFTGFGPYKRIVLFDTLIDNHSPDELTAVLAHEIGHYKHRHIHRMFAVNIAVTGVMLFGIGQLINHPTLFAAFGMDHTSIYASLIFTLILFSPAMSLVGIATNWLSRRHEFQADAFAISTFGKPQVFITALKKLTVDNLGNLHPHPLKVILEYSHPPILERLTHIRQISKSNS